MKYEPKYLVEAALQMWERATWIVWWTALKYTVITATVVFLVGVIARTIDKNFAELPVGVITLSLAALALLIGILQGRALAFDLRVRAQKIVALIQIERNTHPASEASEKILQA